MAHSSTNPPRIIFFLAFLAILGCGLSAAEIRHRFLAVDESRGQVHLVDQIDPAKGWQAPLAGKFRDVQLIGNGQLLFSTGNGYRVHELASQKLVKELSDGKFSGCTSVRRRKDGSTVLACNQSNITLYVLDPSDAVRARFEFAGLRNVRLMRLTPAGTALFGANESLCEASLADGALKRKLALTNAKHTYQLLSLANGNVLVATGYGASLIEVNAAGDCVRQWGGKPGPEGLGYNFFSGMQILGNGNLVVCNWTGHKSEDSSKGAQLLEFSPKGELVWKWHDPTRAGTLHGVIVLDGLDPAVLHDDLGGVLAAQR